MELAPADRLHSPREDKTTQMSKAEKTANKIANEAEDMATIAETPAVEIVKTVVKEVSPTKPVNGIIVEDPLILRPKTLPLVIKPESGAWANEAQAEFAAVLNGYAYKNTAKWNKKKDVLLKQLAELADTPEKIFALKGEPEFQADGSGVVKFKNQLLQN